MVFAIYVDSYVFVLATAMLQHVFGVSLNPRSCDGAILLCLVCYVTTKVSCPPCPVPLAAAVADATRGRL